MKTGPYSRITGIRQRLHLSRQRAFAIRACEELDAEEGAMLEALDAILGAAQDRAQELQEYASLRQRRETQKTS